LANIGGTGGMTGNLIGLILARMNGARYHVWKRLHHRHQRQSCVEAGEAEGMHGVSQMWASDLNVCTELADQ
jgi:hypothetical protein